MPPPTARPALKGSKVRQEKGNIDKVASDTNQNILFMVGAINAISLDKNKSQLITHHILT